MTITFTEVDSMFNYNWELDALDLHMNKIVTYICSHFHIMLLRSADYYLLWDSKHVNAIGRSGKVFHLTCYKIYKAVDLLLLSALTSVKWKSISVASRRPTGDMLSGTTQSSNAIITILCL